MSDEREAPETTPVTEPVAPPGSPSHTSGGPAPLAAPIRRLPTGLFDRLKRLLGR